MVALSFGLPLCGDEPSDWVEPVLVEEIVHNITVLHVGAVHRQRLKVVRKQVQLISILSRLPDGQDVSHFTEDIIILKHGVADLPLL